MARARTPLAVTAFTFMTTACPTTWYVLAVAVACTLRSRWRAVAVLPWISYHPVRQLIGWRPCHFLRVVHAMGVALILK